MSGRDLYSACSVSYTHLDVYKRQVGRRVTEDDGPALQNRKFLKSHPDSEITRTFVSVSYTHLDVYKRQPQEGRASPSLF